MGTTTKSTWYKHAVIEGEPMTLEAALRLALEQLSSASDRLAEESDGVFVGLNSWRDHAGLLFGQFLTFQPGMQHSLVTIDETKEVFDVAAIAAEQKDGKKQEFLDSVAYFGVSGNHVILAQTKALDSRDLEGYFHWLLKAQTEVVSKDAEIILEDPAATKTRKKHARANIRGLSIGAAVTAAQGNVAENATANVDAGTYVLNGAGANVLRSILPDGVFDNLSLKSSLEDDNIEVRVTVRVKGRVNSSPSAEKLLRALGRATRHMNERDYRLELRNGDGELVQDTLRVKHSYSVKTTTTGGLVDEEDFCLKMSRWLQHLIAEGYAEDD